MDILDDKLLKVRDEDVENVQHEISILRVAKLQMLSL